jgi:peptidoglycan hydrolase-like protein with peptidoglycan-binding domain
VWGGWREKIVSIGGESKTKVFSWDPGYRWRGVVTTTQMVFLAFSLFLTSLVSYGFGYSSSTAMPLPFTRELYVISPLMKGNDVLIAQTLLNRDAAVKPITTDGYYGNDSAQATTSFQLAHELKGTGILDATTAQLLLDLHSADGYVDSGFTAASMGYKYKIHLPVYANRSIEAVATLYDANNKVLVQFTARSHGHRNDGSSAPWPDFGNGDVGLNEFTSNGNTVTGLFEVDLNSPEPDPTLYGPYPVNRLVRGLDGNALLLVPNIRDGLLFHTGNWSTTTDPWTPSEDMPNSSGCVHGHPNDIKMVYEELVKIGVVVNPNPFSGKNYPYQPQGVAVVELIV